MPNNSSKIIGYGRHLVDTKDIHAVSKVLAGDRLSQGPTIAEFEKRFAAYCGAKYAVAVSNGTAGLHLACLAAGLSAGKNVITTPLTFIATANAVLYAGGRPVFSDISADLNLDITKLRSKINANTQAILPVHFAGVSCEMKAVQAIAKKNKLVVIEDACHALGGVYEGTRIGSCRYSDMSVFSFHPVKSITTGEGGMITTNSAGFYQKLQDLRNHGTRRGQRRTNFKDPWAYEMYDLGFNCRLTDIQAALGIEQLKKLERYISLRRKIATFYLESFKQDSHFEIPQKNFLKTSAWHLFIVKFNGPNAAAKRLLAYQEFLKNGISSQVHYTPVYWQPYYRKLGYKKGLCPVAEEIYEGILSIPIFPGLKLRDAKRVVKVLKSLP